MKRKAKERKERLKAKDKTSTSKRTQMFVRVTKDRRETYERIAAEQGYDSFSHWARSVLNHECGIDSED